MVKKVKSDDSETDVIATAHDALGIVASTLHHCVSRVRDELTATGAEYDYHEANHMGDLGRHIAVLLSEARKAEAERRKQAELSPSQIDEYIKRAGPDQLAQIQRSLSARSNKRSVLS